MENRSDNEPGRTKGDAAERPDPDHISELRGKYADIKVSTFNLLESRHIEREREDAKERPRV